MRHTSADRPAATRASVDTARAIAASLSHDGAGGEVLDHEPSYWLRDQLRRLERTTRGRHARPCPHMRPGGPQPLAALWAPGVVACGVCSVLALAVDEAEDHSCDRCHEEADVVVPCVVVRGRLIVLFALCRPCHRKEVAR